MLRNALKNISSHVKYKQFVLNKMVCVALYIIESLKSMGKLELSVKSLTFALREFSFMTHMITEN